MTDHDAHSYADSTMPRGPITQEIVFFDRSGNPRRLVFKGTPSIDDLVAIVRDARFRCTRFDDDDGPPPPRLVT